MIPLSIGSATAVYGDASRCVITRHLIDHAELASVSQSLRALVHSLGDEIADQFWYVTLGPIRRLAFALCSTPMPFALVASAASVDWSKINRQARLCEHQFPDYHKPLSDVIETLAQLTAEQTSPLIGPLEALSQQCGRLSVVTRNPRMNRAITEYFAGNALLRNAQIVSATQLRGAHACDVLAAIGPCGWHPEYVLTAPRAPAIHVLSFRWIRDTWKPGPVLLHETDSSGKHHNHCLGPTPRIGGEYDHDLVSPTDVLPPDLLPPIPAFVRNPSASSGVSPDSWVESVPARLCHLSGGRAVLVAADDSATSLRIDTSESGRAAVKRVAADELEPGQYLLLRTSGGGDFIAPLADRILGALAPQRRSEQAEWKTRLVSTAIQRFGPASRRDLAQQVCARLRAGGRPQTQPGNVYYWMSSKCIRPRSEEDFAAILSFAGMGARARELWAAMGEINRAHIRAGHLIRRMLLQRISESSLEPLARDGEMVFDLGEHDGGTLSAFQITGIQVEELEVSPDQIGVLLDGEE